MKERLKAGVSPTEIGKKSVLLSDNKVLIKGAQGRYVVEVSGNQVDILGISYRGDLQSMQTFQRLMNDIYNLNLQY